MSSATIMLVDDNPHVRRVVGAVLRNAGYTVQEAPDGRSALELMKAGAPDLILQDLMLPDMDGTELVKQLRALPGGTSIPILAFSGFASTLEDARIVSGFDDFIAKPIESARLLPIVRSHLPLRTPPPRADRASRRVLLVDDDPVQLKLMKLHLCQAGYEVETATGGSEAFELARRTPPDAVLSDVLMTGVDGFSLCLAIRRDPRLARLPVVLISAAYVEEGDQEIAAQVGANALVIKSPDPGGFIVALESALASDTTPPVAEPVRWPDIEHTSRVIRQLERQSTLNAQLARRLAIQAGELSMLRFLSRAMAGQLDFDQALGDVITHCFDVGGFSKSAVFLAGESGYLALHLQRGYAESDRALLDGFFGHREVLERVVDRAVPLVIPSSQLPETLSTEILTSASAGSALVLPLVTPGERPGALLIASRGKDLAEDKDWTEFGEMLALQIGQAIALRRARARLEASETRHRTMMEQAHDGIVVIDATGRILEVNVAAEQIFKRLRSHVIGRPFLEFVDPPDLARAQETLRLLAVRGSIRVNGLHIQPVQGKPTPVDVAATATTADRKVSFLTLRDTTEHDQLEARIRQSEKMNAVGRLAGGVAHDFNNLLTVMMGHCGILCEELATNPAVSADVNAIQAATRRASSLTRQLLAFSRKQVLEPQIFNLNTTVIEIEKMLRRLIGEDIELRTVLDQSLGLVRADPGQIEQVIMNLAVNARDAMPRGGWLALETSNAELDEEYTNEHPGLVPGSYVSLVVSDSGSGMNAEVLSHVFEPFFTTKERGKGTGLGLATVYGIVKQSAGHVAVYSEVARGTTFKIFLPRVDEVPSAPRAGSEARPTTGSETILLVEDDEMVRLMARRILEKAGYTVLEAALTADVDGLVEKHGGTVHLLLTDVVMPKENGRDLATRLGLSRPDMKVLYMSGYTDDSVVHHGVLNAGPPFISKPFTARALLAKVRELLDSTGQAES